MNKKKIIHWVDDSRKDGFYGFYYKNVYSCSKCKKIIAVDRYQIKDYIKERGYKYCPYCAHKLKVGEENE